MFISFIDIFILSKCLNHLLTGLFLANVYIIKTKRIDYRTIC